MDEVVRRIEALAGPIAAAFGCEVVAVRVGQGGRRALVTVFLDTAPTPPTEDELRAAAVPFDPRHDAPPPPYEGSRVSIDVCARASRELGAVIDAEGAIQGSYVLEVSSPGVDRPLVRPADFVRHRGRAIDVRTVEPFDGSRRLRGVLAAADAEGITVLPEGGSVAGVVPPAARRIRLGDVASARLVVDVPRPSRPGRPADKVRKR